MPSGGKRPGAGRKRGSLTKRTRAIAEKALDEGILPLEVMLKGMREHAANEDWDKAHVFAKDAAPYLHPRLAAIEHTGKDGDAIKFEDVSDASRARALAAFIAKTKAPKT